MAAVVNICFHGIGEPARDLEPGESRYWIGSDLYERILDEIAERDDVRLSFDDGNASDVELGLPGLVRRGLTASFFVLAGRLDRPGSLREDDVRTLRDHGMAVGNHGMRHVSWRGLDGAGAVRELLEARDRISAVAERPVDRAALPLGQYDRRVLARLRAAGYREVCTSDRRPARPGAWLQPRYSVTGTDTIDSLRASVLSPRPARERLAREAVGLVKRWR